MTEWIPCGEGFIQADVIRWKEGVFERRGPGQGRAMRIGDRLVIAEVLSEADEEGWVWLLVRSCEIVSEKPGRRKVEKLKNGREVKRKRSTVMRGKPARMLWSDESARDITASPFLGNRKPVPSSSKDKREN